MANKQAVIFELLSGLFGWVWIGASFAAIGFIGGALFLDWSWWNVLYAALIGGISKWLLRGFLDNKKRAIFEQKMIEEGLTKEEAAQKWIELYSEGKI